MKSKLLLFLTIALFAQISVYSQQKNALPKCNESRLKNPVAENDIICNICTYGNAVFICLGTPDYKGRYNYEYTVQQIRDGELVYIKNSELFQNQKQLEELINLKIKKEYEENLKIRELNECMSFIKLRNYSMDEMGISFREDKIEFNIDFEITSACMNVGGTTISIPISQVEKFFK